MAVFLLLCLSVLSAPDGSIEELVLTELVIFCGSSGLLPIALPTATSLPTSSFPSPLAVACLSASIWSICAWLINAEPTLRFLAWRAQRARAFALLLSHDLGGLIVIVLCQRERNHLALPAGAYIVRYSSLSLPENL